MNSEPLSALDSVFVTMDSANAPLHVGALIELEGLYGSSLDPGVRFSEIRSTIEERLGSIEVLRRRVVRVPFDLGPPLLIDDPEFDLDFHVVRRAVPSPGGPRQVDALVAQIMALPLAPDRPLWEINVIEGLEDHRTALLVKLHHALADGVSGVMVFAGLFDLDPANSSEVVPNEPLAAPPLPSPMEMLARSSSEILRRPGAFLEALGSSLERLAGRVDELMGTVAGAQPSNEDGPSLFDAPTTSLSGTISYARNFERFRLNLTEVKEAAGRHGGTVTDFAMTIIGGALRRLLEERGEPTNRDLVAFVPINIRVPGTESQLGNRISGRLVPLSSTISDPLERLASVAERNGAHRASEEPTSDVLSDIAEAAGPAVASVAGKVLGAFELYDHLPHVANVIVSSVPGPPIPLWCAGERIVRVAPIGPLMFNQGLNVTLLSYCDTIEFGVLGCARKVPDAELLCELLEEEAAALLSIDEMGASSATSA